MAGVPGRRRRIGLGVWAGPRVPALRQLVRKQRSGGRGPL